MKGNLKYILTTILWIALIILAIIGKPQLLIFLICLHLLEMLIIGYKVGKSKGKSTIETIANCMAWGFLWWLPLKNS